MHTTTDELIYTLNRTVGLADMEGLKGSGGPKQDMNTRMRTERIQSAIGARLPGETS